MDRSFDHDKTAGFEDLQQIEILSPQFCCSTLEKNLLALVVDKFPVYNDNQTKMCDNFDHTVPKYTYGLVLSYIRRCMEGQMPMISFVYYNISTKRVHTVSSHSVVNADWPTSGIDILGILL